MTDFLDDRRVNATVASAAWIQSGGGTQAIHINFDFESPESDPLGNGAASITHDVWITPKSANMAHKSLKTLGVDTDTVDSQKFKYEINGLLEGHACVLVCGIEEANEYHQDDRWKVKFINAPGAVGDVADPLDLLRSRPLSDKKPRTKKAPALPLTSAPTRAARPSDDDVPF